MIDWGIIQVISQKYFPLLAITNIGIYLIVRENDRKQDIEMALSLLLPCTLVYYDPMWIVEILKYKVIIHGIVIKYNLYYSLVKYFPFIAITTILIYLFSPAEKTKQRAFEIFIVLLVFCFFLYFDPDWIISILIYIFSCFW